MYLGGDDALVEYNAGWLGDATIKTQQGGKDGKKEKVNFTQDDYKADLDAANIMQLIRTSGLTFDEAVTQYNEQLKNGASRATLFLAHTPLQEVERLILRTLALDTREALKNDEGYYDTYVFLLNLEAESHELQGLHVLAR